MAVAGWNCILVFLCICLVVTRLIVITRPVDMIFGFLRSSSSSMMVGAVLVVTVVVVVSVTGRMGWVLDLLVVVDHRRK